MKIYLASSWKNEAYPRVLRELRERGHDVFDFRNPRPGNRGFHWSEIDPDYREWSTGEFIKTLQTAPLAIKGLETDLAGLHGCEVCVLLLPCGKSAHLELGYAIGRHKQAYILALEPRIEPELMYGMVNGVATSVDELASWLLALSMSRAAWGF